MLAGWDEIPWAELAFPSVRWALEQYQAVEGRDDFAPFSNPPGEFGDAKPTDLGFVLDHVLRHEGRIGEGEDQGDAEAGRRP